jgi:exodeoxyribonuclease V alpha subunit
MSKIKIAKKQTLIATGETNLKSQQEEDEKQFERLCKKESVSPTHIQLLKVLLEQKVMTIKKLKGVVVKHEMEREALQKMLDNPYKLCGLIPPVISYRTCEKIEKCLNLKIDPHYKMDVFLYWLFIKNQTLYLQKTNQCNHDICDEIIKFCGENNTFMKKFRKMVAYVSYKTCKYCIPIGILKIETDIRDLVAELVERQHYDDADKDKIVYKISDIYTHRNKDHNLQLNNEQRIALRAIIYGGDLVCLTGYPGTGKTVIITLLAEYYNQIGKTISFTAVSGMAVSNLKQGLCKTEIDTKRHYLGTICRTFMIDFKDSKKKTGKDIDVYHKKTPDVMFVDESSMVGYCDFLMILKYCYKNHCKLVLIGDGNQLPPIGLGQLFQDLIDVKICPISKLSTIVRQKSESSLLQTIKNIGESKFTMNNVVFDDCKFIPSTDEQIIKNLSTQLIGSRPDQTIVLVGQNGGKYGTINLNKWLQKYYGLHKNPELFRNREYNYHLGDRVYRIKNDYSSISDGGDGAEDLIQYNGEGYYLKGLDNANAKLQRIYDECEFVENKDDFLEEFVLGYTTTVHKSQGSQYDTVIILIPIEHKFMWMKTGRKLLYTAISRAKSKCTIIGNESLLMECYKNNTHVKTGFNMI